MVECQVRIGDRVLHVFRIEEGSRLTVGRGQTADVNLDNTAVSREHAVLTMTEGKIYLIDLDSTNGTHINGKRVSGRVSVRVGDEIQIGKFKLLPLQESTPAHVTPADFEGTVFVSPKGENGGKAREQSKTLTLIKGAATPQSISLKAVDRLTLGRDDMADIVVPGWRVARTQCYISRHEDLYILTHRGGWKRTTLNGRKVRNEEQLREGDIIGMGSTRLRFS